MNLKIPFYYHIVLFIGLFLTLYLWGIGVDNQKMELILNKNYFLFKAGFILSIFIVYLFNFYIFCTWFLSKRKMLYYLLSIPVSLFIFAGVRYVVEEVIVFELTGIHNYAEKTREMTFYIRDNFFFGLPAVILSTLSYLLWHFQETQQQNQKLLLENKKAEFIMLKSQVSPHFLFNTLNSFYSQLIIKNDEMASDVLVLSDLLRYVITETDKDEAMLSKEIQFIQNYIHLQKKRFEDQLFLDFLVEGNYSTEKIISSALIHFVENVFKHGKLNNSDEKALISIKIQNSFLEISTLNYCIKGENYSSTGIGFDNLTKRLKYTYADKYLLEKIAENNTYKTYLKIPLKK